MSNNEDECSRKRLFIGGLFDRVTQVELTERFAKFGVVECVEIHVKRDPAGKL